MNKKLYVGNLTYEVTVDQLRELFAPAGSIVDAVVISDRMTGRSKGFGFVEFATEEEAKKAVEMFHGQSFQSRDLVVNIARPKEDRPARPWGGGGGGGGNQW